MTGRKRGMNPGQGQDPDTGRFQSVPMPNHGDRRMYLRGCRCPECFAANARYQRDYRERRKGSVSA